MGGPRNKKVYMLINITGVHKLNSTHVRKYIRSIPEIFFYSEDPVQGPEGPCGTLYGTTGPRPERAIKGPVYKGAL